ncbi:hypothetical protein Pan241w_11650 [Gimesia alba]|uniref:Uncharacterized protein n=1 Tax=Gimesia alba TaxID=2527973 RepID=A0A517RB46_9PLAN|nr:hypothetical protein [Gimesia alba]QDT41106.1 hypothetical protein Pan241w_11650 [Gimesia alba]
MGKPQLVRVTVKSKHDKDGPFLYEYWNLRMPEWDSGKAGVSGGFVRLCHEDLASNRRVKAEVIRQAGVYLKKSFWDLWDDTIADLMQQANTEVVYI